MQLNNSESNLLECLPEKNQNISVELNAYFDSLRQRGDAEADALVKEVFGQPTQKNRIAFNHLLDIADKLAENPELVLNADTEVAQELKDYPEKLIKYFSPAKAPDWVDEEKLNISGKLWQKDMLAIISVLYSISLPACYLMKNGIPALYQTAKLTSKRYIYQRIYETGIMLDAVLSPDGLNVVHDIDHSSEEHLAEAMNKIDPTGQWKKRGKSMIRKGAESNNINVEELEQQLKKYDTEKECANRYLYGKGYVTAKKVRFLHATMRFMLTNPELFPAHTHIKDKKTFTDAISHIEEPYDSTKLGVPVNQEDLAYTLLTFGYCIATGLEKLGRKWDIKEKEAFLHTWKVIGHTIGIQENLMTDNWDEAEKLFHTIQKRQAGSSEQAKVLTSTLLNFFEDYLPAYFGINKGIAARLIRKQLGDEQTKMIMPEDYIKASSGIITVILYSIGMLVIKTYYRVRRLLYKLPFIAVFFEKTFYDTGIELVNSWRGVYSRKPFYIAKTADEWQVKKGVNPFLLTKLKSWRQKLFNTVALGIGSVIASFISSLVYASSVFIQRHAYESISGWASIGLVTFGILVLRYRVRNVSQNRPLIEDHPRVETSNN